MEQSKIIDTLEMYQDPARKKNEPMKKTNGRSRTDSSQLRNETEANEGSNPERSKQHNKQPSHKHGMMRKQV